MGFVGVFAIVVDDFWSVTVCEPSDYTFYVWVSGTMAVLSGTSKVETMTVRWFEPAGDLLMGASYGGAALVSTDIRRGVVASVDFKGFFSIVITDSCTDHTWVVMLG